MPPAGRGGGYNPPQLNLGNNQPAVPNLPPAMLAPGGFVPIGAPVIPQFAPAPLQIPFVPMNLNAGAIVNAPLGAGIVPIMPQVGRPEQNITGEIPRDAPSEDILY